MILCFALGIANLFTVNVLIIILSAICLYAVPLSLPPNNPPLTKKHSLSSFIILFIEVPLLLRICPTSSSFDVFIRKITTNYMRAAAYAAMAVAQWLTLLPPGRATSLLAAAVLLSLTCICYTLAAVKGQAFVGSKTLGGAGVAQMIV